jgi:hypothetical protein
VVVERKNGNRSGFRLPDRVAVLDFSDTEYDGAEVRLRLNIPLGVTFQIQDAVESGKERDILGEFANAVLLSWNLLDRDDNEIPADANGLEQIDAAFLATIMGQWANAVGAIPDPLAEISDGGST